MRIFRPLFFCLAALLFLSSPTRGDNYEESIQSERSFPLLGGPTKAGPDAQWAIVQDFVKRDKTGAAIKHAGYLVDTWPDHPRAVDAQRLKADLYFAREQYRQAFDAYQGLIDSYAGLFNYGGVLAQQLEAARKLEHKTYKAFFGLTSYKQPMEAIPLYRQLLTNAPHMREAPRILYDMGDVYLRRSQFDEAVQEFRLLEQRYPNSPLAEQAALKRAEAFAKKADRNPTDIRPVEGELATLTHILVTYPDSDHLEEVRLKRKKAYDQLAENRYEQARFYERKMRRPEAAVVGYRSLLEQFPDSEWTENARKRILALTDKAD